MTPGTAAGETSGDQQTQRPAVPSISLPKGGGVLKSIDETGTVNPSSITASLLLSLPFSPARGGYLPPVHAPYDSGTGNDVLGIGWSLDMPSIRRRTDAQLLCYRGEVVFLFQGAELMPSSKSNGISWTRDIAPAGLYLIERYRPRFEGEFARIEHWTNTYDATDVFLRSISKDNITTWYGKASDSRIADRILRFEYAARAARLDPGWLRWEMGSTWDQLSSQGIANAQSSAVTAASSVMGFLWFDQAALQWHVGSGVIALRALSGSASHALSQRDAMARYAVLEAPSRRTRRFAALRRTKAPSVRMKGERAWPR